MLKIAFEHEFSVSMNSLTHHRPESLYEYMAIIKIPWMQGSKIAARVSRQWSNLTNDEMMAMMMKVTNIYKHEIVDTRA